MSRAFHFISGLPRSGSTLLSALLRQNPAAHAHISSPVQSLVGAMLNSMSQRNEAAVFIEDGQRERLLRAVFEAYYSHLPENVAVFDTSRGWTERVDLLARLFPECRIVCCVRHVPWVIDSVERLIRNNPFELSGIFGFEAGGTVYSRADGLMGPNGMIGYALAGLKQAMHSVHSARLLLVPMDLLTSQPQNALDAIYDFCGLPRFVHDPENVAFDTEEFDRRLGTPGLHRVRRGVTHEQRETILPPDLWTRYEGASLWRDPAFARRPVSAEAAGGPGGPALMNHATSSGPARGEQKQ